MENLIELISKIRRPNLRVRAYETKCNANGEGSGGAKPCLG